MDKKEGDMPIMEAEKTKEVQAKQGERIELLKKFEDRPKYVMLEKTKALYTMMHPYLELFPKSEKFTLRSKIEEVILDSIKLLVLQNYQQTNEERRKIMLGFLANLYLLEVLLQQVAIFRYLSYEGFDRCVSLLREINNSALSRYKNLNGGRENEKI
ncbi:MAG: hypothetical protein WCP89_02890 [archaeon]